MPSRRQHHTQLDGDDLKAPLILPSQSDIKRLSTSSSSSSLSNFFGTSAGGKLLGAIAVVAVIAVGLGLGFTLPVNHELHPKEYARASSVVGWMYFACWSFSFYPQIYENWRRKSVHGLSFDFEVYNILGFGCYSIFNCALFWSEKMQRAYAQHHDGKSSPVEMNDVFFSLHALAATLFTCIQCVVYERGGQRVSELCKLVTVVTVLGATGYGALTLIGKQLCDCFSVLSWLYLLSYVKLAVTVFKYMPQIYLNYARKSTAGWSISNCLLDIAGGSMSLTQMFADAFVKADYSAITGDPVKFGLGFVSMIADVIIMVQHYILYPAAVQSKRGTGRQYEAVQGLGDEEEGGCGGGPGCAAVGELVDQGGTSSEGTSSWDDDDSLHGDNEAPAAFKPPAQQLTMQYSGPSGSFVLPPGSYVFTTVSTPQTTPMPSLSSVGLRQDGALHRSAEAEEQEAAARHTLLPVHLSDMGQLPVSDMGHHAPGQVPVAPAAADAQGQVWGGSAFGEASLQQQQVGQPQQAQEPSHLSSSGSVGTQQVMPRVLSSRSNSGALVYVVVENGAITLTSSVPSVVHASPSPAAGGSPVASTGTQHSSPGPV